MKTLQHGLSPHKGNSYPLCCRSLNNCGEGCAGLQALCLLIDAILWSVLLVPELRLWKCSSGRGVSLGAAAGGSGCACSTDASGKWKMSTFEGKKQMLTAFSQLYCLHSDFLLPGTASSRPPKFGGKCWLGDRSEERWSAWSKALQRTRLAL